MRTLMWHIKQPSQLLQNRNEEAARRKGRSQFQFRRDEKQNKTWGLEPRRSSAFTNGDGPRRSEASAIPLTFNLKSLKVFVLHLGTCGLCLSAILKVVQAQRHRTHSWCVCDNVRAAEVICFNGPGCFDGCLIVVLLQMTKKPPNYIGW